MIEGVFDPLEGPRVIRKMIEQQEREPHGLLRAHSGERIIVVEAVAGIGGVVFHALWRHEPEDGSLSRTDHGAVLDRRTFVAVWQRLGDELAATLPEPVLAAAE